MTNTFSKENRLTKKPQFDNCINHGKRYKIWPFSCFLITNNLECNRLGIIVSKKWHKSAAKRNLLKRRIRESFRLINTNKKFDIVIFPSKTNINYLQVTLLWKKLLKLQEN